MKTKELAFAMADKLRDLRREFHMYPEVSFKEERTSARIREILTGAGIEIIDVGLETGVVGMLDTGRPGPTVALRADIDALPIQEQNEVEYKSKVPGVMHACGHDIHTACLLGAALILSSLRDSFGGKVKFFFQPAEEVNMGAKIMLKAGVLENPKVDAIFCFHTQPDIPASKVGVKVGPLMAAVDSIGITVNGVGGHGALPHHTSDPIVAASAIVLALQTVVSRSINPLESVVVSIGTFNAGTANNVIPDVVELTGTVRTFNPELRDAIPAMMEKIIQSTAEAYGSTASLIYRRDLPAVINSKLFAEMAAGIVHRVCGADCLVDPLPSTGGEDFSLFMEKVPGLLMWLGVGNGEKGINHQWHHPRFDADESCLPLGASVLAQCVLEAAAYLDKENGAA